MRVRNLLKRPLSDQWLLLQAFVLLGTARLAINRFSFARLERFLGERHAESGATIAPEHVRHARKVCWAIALVSPLTPWRSDCLPQAIVGKWLLRRRGIGSTLYIGAAFAPDGSALLAHAWLRCGPFYLTGGNGEGQFGAVVSFGE